MALSSILVQCNAMPIFSSILHQTDGISPTVTLRLSVLVFSTCILPEVNFLQFVYFYSKLIVNVHVI